MQPDAARQWRQEPGRVLRFFWCDAVGKRDDEPVAWLDVEPPDSGDDPAPWPLHQLALDGFPARRELLGHLGRDVALDLDDGWLLHIRPKRIGLRFHARPPKLP